MENIKSIMVVWWWTSWYLTVYYLLKKYKDIKIKWIFPEDNKTIWVWEATIPEVQDFLINELQISLNTIINKCNWSLKLWLKFEWFYKKDEYYFHPFWKGIKKTLVNSILMDNNFVNNSLLLDKNYAIHFDVSKLLDFIDEEIKSYDNIEIYREYIEDISLENWSIKQIWKYSSDLYIDCSWFKRLLLDKVKSDNFIDITDKIPNNSSLVYRDIYSDAEKQRKNYTTCKAMDYWWCWNIPLKETLSIWYVYDDKYDVYDEFKKYLKSTFWEIKEENIFHIKLKTWRNKYHFYNNVYSVWLSSCFIEPLESTWLYFVTENIKLLWEFINWSISKDNINNKINNNFDNVLNFIIAHYKYTHRSNDYWNFYKNIEIEEFKKNDLFYDTNLYMVMKWMGQSDYMKSYLWISEYNKYKLIEKILDKDKILDNSIDYNKWLYSSDYQKFVD